MNEAKKTGIFVGVAAVVTLVAWLAAPRITNPSLSALAVKVGHELFEGKFTDPVAASNLKIVKFEEGSSDFKTFEVTRDKKNGGWLIPSKENYLADAANQMSKAANALIQVKVYALASTKPDDQAYFGVVEPDPEKHRAGEKGVGTLVRMQNEKSESLASLVIGKADGENPKRRFVRIPGTDLIYNVDVDATPFTTDFSKWIDEDLLKLSSTDIQTIGIRNYAIVLAGAQAQMERIYDADISFTTTTGTWNVDTIKAYQGREATPRLLTDDEQLNKTKLDEIKNTLDSLKIVDVRRKPKGLAADLKAENALLNDNESRASLISRGFIPIPGGEGATDILSVNGELLTSLNNGVQYVLRFGNTAGTGEQADEAKETESSSPGLNRYLLVSARLNDGFYPEPVLQKLPETVEEMKQIEQASKAATQLQGSSLPREGINSSPLPTAPSSPEIPAPNPVDESTSPAAPSEIKSDSTSGNQSSNIKVGDSRFVALQAPAVETPAVADKEETPQELKERLEAMREQLKKENDRRVEERADKIKAARKKVDELNARFAEWYYVVSESDYKKLKIDLKDLIQPKTAAAPPAGSPPAFNPNMFQQPGGN